MGILAIWHHILSSYSILHSLHRPVIDLLSYLLVGCVVVFFPTEASYYLQHYKMFMKSKISEINSVVAMLCPNPLTQFSQAVKMRNCENWESTEQNNFAGMVEQHMHKLTVCKLSIVLNLQLSKQQQLAADTWAAWLSWRILLLCCIVSTWCWQSALL